MKLFIRPVVVFCFGASLVAAQAPQAAKNDHAEAKSEAAEKPLTEIPASAVPAESGSYRYTDAKGKKWILRRTPFGIAKLEDTGDAAKPVVKDHSLDDAKVTEVGDSVRFERPGPFGVYKWEKKKTDLDAGEKAAWEREKAKTAKTTAKQD